MVAEKEYVKAESARRGTYEMARVIEDIEDEAHEALRMWMADRSR